MPVDIQSDRWHRSLEDIQTTYELERILAEKLKTASKEERLGENLYTKAYNEFFSQLPQHPVQMIKGNYEITAKVVAMWMPVLEPFIQPDMTFLEVGPGDCSLSLEMARRVKHVYAIDVSDEVMKGLTVPPNFEMAVSDGCTVPVPENSIDLAYSHQLMEHLHPEDAFEQLQNICKALKPGGRYICITPNRLTGPHDTSMYFDDVATGWHLKEYTVGELHDLFRSAGFSQVNYFKLRQDTNIDLPMNGITTPLIKLTEGLIEQLPADLRRKVALKLAFRGITLIGQK